MEQRPAISVCMPMYNASAHLRECIDSILCQTFADFELLVVDDGSEDDSVAVVESYQDPRIRLIHSRHDFIASLNLLLQEAKGKYIARMDADDIMMPDRLEKQFNYMEGHPDVDLMAGGMQLCGDKIGVYSPVEKVTRIKIDVLIEHCAIAHPTVFLRKSIVVKKHLRYKQEYVYAEDYKLWMDMLQNDCILVNTPDIFIKYRISKKQISRIHNKLQYEHTKRIKEEAQLWLIKKETEVINEEIKIPISGNELSLVIPFCNEGEEVANTVRSARSFVGNQVDIIAINDHSTDGYDYKQELLELGVHYVYNEINIGAAASKEKGARLATTPYFILLDAHMRFYDALWLTRYIEELKRDDNRILCCQTKWLSKNNGIVIEGCGAYTRGAFLCFEGELIQPGIHWDCFPHEGKLHGNQIPAVMGATYGASKRFWDKIKGLKGLIHYGCEEAYISIKSYLCGGECTFIPDVSIGHIYREQSPYQKSYAKTVYNNFLIAYTLFPTSLRCYCLEKIKQKNPEMTKEVLGMLHLREDEWKTLKQYYKSISHRDFSYILDINDRFIPEDRDKLVEQCECLPSIIKCLENAEICVPGIYRGKMALVIFFCHLFELTKKDCYDDKASILFSEVVESLDGYLSPDFSDGLSGIGWAALYLQSHGFIDEVEDILDVIDKKLMRIDPRRIDDFSFDTGLGGLLAYVVARLGHWRRSGGTIPFDEQYLSEIRQKSTELLNTEKEFRGRSYASQLLEFGRDDWKILRPELWEIFDLPSVLNSNKKLWATSMSNCIGYGIYLLRQLIRMSKIKNDNYEIKFLQF